jgi:hypothetical protein
MAENWPGWKLSADGLAPPHRAFSAERCEGPPRASQYKAERLYRSLMAEYPDRTDAVDALVTILQNARRFDEAFKIVDDRLARLPDESSSLYSLGRCQQSPGNISRVANRRCSASSRWQAPIRCVSPTRITVWA